MTPAGSLSRALVLPLALGLVACALRPPARNAARVFEVPADTLEDKIRGGMLGQILGNLNGLPHEMKYIDEPGDVRDYVPALPKGARTDDDTDIEWVYVSEMLRSGDLFIPPGRISGLWRAHINRRIWCANLYARRLMDLGIEPPLTGRIALNPWSDFNISGQFICESFGLMAPAMPRTAARLGLHYTHVTIDGEPAQATQLFTAMIATAYVETDLDRILDAGLAAVDPAGEIHAVVSDVRRLHREHPDDWKAARLRIKDGYQRHGGEMRDRNGYELNTASTVAALLYGQGDFVETLRLAFNFGWDADNNAATAACIVGVIKGRRWMDAQGWAIRDVYRNTSRDGMPEDETLTGFEDKIVALARRVILENGGEETTAGGLLLKVYRIRAESPVNVEPLPRPLDRREELAQQLLPLAREGLGGSELDQARAVYVAICLGEAERLRRERPDDWERALHALLKHTQLLRELFNVPNPAAGALIARAAEAGLRTPGR